MVFLPSLLVSVPLLLNVADPVPTLNVRPSCQASANGSIGLTQDLKTCEEDENDARKQLVKEWGQFRADDRGACLRMTKTGGSPTYTELLTCLEMDRDARNLSKENTTGLAGSDTGIAAGSDSTGTESTGIVAPTTRHGRSRRH